jgi:hypothetical protein
MAAKSKTAQLVKDTNLEAGIQQNQATFPPIIVLGQVQTAASCEAVLKARIAAASDVPPARLNYSVAVAAANAEIASTQPFVTELTQQLVAYYTKNAPATLAQYGLAPKKARAKRSPVTNVVAAAKNAATREQRGTKSKKKLAAIKGTVPTTLSISVSDGKVQPLETSPAAEVVATANGVGGPQHS